MPTNQSFTVAKITPGQIQGPRGATGPTGAQGATGPSSEILAVSKTTNEINAISPATNGMIVYNSTTNKFQGRENGAWVNLI